jgi:hypothetical protein
MHEERMYIFYHTQKKTKKTKTKQNKQTKKANKQQFQVIWYSDLLTLSNPIKVIVETLRI